MKISPLLMILLSAHVTLSADLLNEQFNSLPDYFQYEYENDGGDYPLLHEQFDTLPNYFTYGDDGGGGDITTTINNGTINLLTNGLPETVENKIEISYSINPADASGILYFTIEAGNAAAVSDGGLYVVLEDGDMDPLNLAEAGISFNQFNGDGLITLENENGTKRIRYSNSLYGDGYENVDNFDKVYLRLSYNFNTSYFKTYYSNDGVSFTELSEIYAPQSSTFGICLEAESRNVAFNQGEVYFDNFVIADSPIYNLDSTDSNDLEVNASNGVLNVISDGGAGEKELEILYPVDSSKTDTGILYATVLANNSKNVLNVGNEETHSKVECGLGFSNFSGNGWISLVNRNGSKTIEYTGGELNVSSLDDIYLRVSYDFSTQNAKSYYSNNGEAFIELGNESAPNDNFYVSLEIETSNIALEEGDLYFDNFVIAEDTSYDSSMSDNPYDDPVVIVDSDGDNVADSEDPFPNDPLELEKLGPSDFQPKENVGWIEVTYAYFNDLELMPGIWHPIDESFAAWFAFDNTWSYENAYIWDSENLATIGPTGEVGQWSHYKTSNPNIYTCKFDFTNGTNGYGFTYDGRIDLDNDGSQDGIQIRSGVQFPAQGSQLDFHQILSALSDNLGIFALPTNFTVDDYDGDGKNNATDIDDDNDGIADIYDLSPLVYTVSNTSVPTSLSGYVEVYFSDYDSSSYGVWFGNGENSSINIWNDGVAEFISNAIYSWDSQSLISTGSSEDGGGIFRTNFKDKTNDAFFVFTYVSEQNELYPDDSGKGFFYDGQMDLDNNGVADGVQIQSGAPFPDSESTINFSNIYSSAISNFIPIEALNYTSNEKYFLNELQDLRPDSTMVEVLGDQAVIELQMEESSDLQTWEDAGDPATMSVPVPTDSDTKFYRFKIAD